MIYFWPMGLKNVMAKFIFCWNISADAATALRLMYDTKKFNSIYNAGKYNNGDNHAEGYKLNIAGKPRNIKMRLLNGDLNMFYEVLYSAIYALPASIIKKPLTILDFGANIGFASLYFADRFPDAAIIAVEPSLRNFNLLQQNVSSLQQVIPVHAAVYPSPGQVPFFDDELAYNSRIGDNNRNSYPVRAITVDELLEEQGWDKVDLLKLDIEGAEQLLLAENTEWLHKVSCIIVELHKPYGIADFAKDILPYGFKVRTPEETGLKMIIAVKAGM